MVGQLKYLWGSTPAMDILDLGQHENAQGSDQNINLLFAGELTQSSPEELNDLTDFVLSIGRS